MKRKRKIISILSIIAVLALSATTIGLIAYYCSNKNTKKLDNSLEQNQKLANMIGSYINDPIKIKSNLNSNQALLKNNVNETKSLILSSIQSDLMNKKFNIDGNVYNGSVIYKNITVDLPGTVLYNNYINGEISNVKLVYKTNNSEITIQPKDATSYTVVGFSIANNSTQNNTINKNVVNKLNSLLNEYINVANYENMSFYSAADALNEHVNTLKEAITSAIEAEINNNFNSTFNIDNITYNADEIIKDLAITLPNAITLQDDENAQIPNIKISYKGISLESKNGTNTFIIDGFSDEINNKNDEIAKILNSLLNQVINISNYNNISSYTAAIVLSEHNDDLISAIKNEIANEINNNISKFNFAGTSYTANEIINEIHIELPIGISQQEDIKAQIQNVTLSYNGILLKPTASTSTNSTSINSNQNNFIIDGFKTISISEIGTIPITVNETTSSSSSSNNSGQITTRNQEVANELDTLLNKVINVSNYNDMSSYTAADALTKHNANLITAIKDEIATEISNINNFIFGGILYSASEIVSGIQIDLPTNVSLTSDESGQITGVSLSYNGIKLMSNSFSTNSTIINDFIVEGFIPVNSTQTGYNPGGKGNSANRNHQIATKLDSFLNQIIQISGFSTITAADALNDQLTKINNNLESAIVSAIQSEIKQSKETFNIDGIGYSATDISNGIEIGFPKSVSLTDDENAQIPNITLSYNGISITTKTINNTSTNDFIIEGFTKPSASQIGYNPGGKGNNTNRNHQIASKLDSLLNQIINISKEPISSYTAADSLNSTLTNNLKSAIIQVIENEISSSKISFIIDSIAYTASQIANEITIELPQAVATQYNSNGQIPGVLLSYNGIKLTSKSSSTNSSTNSFIVQGFKVISSNQANINYNRNQQVAKKLFSLLNSTINVSNYEDMNEYSAAEALSDLSTDNLKTAIIDAIENEITKSNDSFDIDGISYTASEIANNITITLPNFITLLNDIDLEIPNVSLSYNGMSLISNTSSKNFVINGFNNIPKEKIVNAFNETLTNYDRNTFYFSSFKNIDSYTAQNIINNTPIILHEDFEELIKIVFNNYYIDNCFLFNDSINPQSIRLGVQNLLSNISYTLPKIISQQNNLYGQIPNVSLEYDGITLALQKSRHNTTSFYFTGFSNQISNINQKFVNILDSLLNNTINVSSYENMSLYTASLAWLSESNSLNQAITDAIETEIKTHISLFVYDNYSYTLQYILNTIYPTLPDNVSMQDNISGQIPDVTLYYEGILDGNSTQLIPKGTSNSSSTNTFTITGFCTVSEEILNELNSLPNDINVAKYDDMDSYTAAQAFNDHWKTLQQAIISAIKNEIASVIVNGVTFTASQIAANIEVIGPGMIWNQDNKECQSSVGLMYKGITITPKTGSNTFNVTGFSSPSINNNTMSYINYQIANNLDSWIPSIIDVGSCKNIDSYTAQEALNNHLDELKSAILSVIYHDIYSDTVNGITYSCNKIINNIEIIFPLYLWNSNNLTTEISGVQLAYNGILLSWTGLGPNSAGNETSNIFFIDGFNNSTSSTSSTSTNINNGIYSKLNRLLSDSIDIQNYNSMSSYTAADALCNYSISLQEAIINAIENEISNDIKNNTISFNTQDSLNTVTSIANNIQVILPQTVSISNNQSSEIPDVELSYNGIFLYSNTLSKLFIIDGFKSATINEMNSNNDQIIINDLNEAFTSNIINVSYYDNMWSYTAQEALNDHFSSLQSALKSAILNDIEYYLEYIEVKVNGIFYTYTEIANNIQIIRSQATVISNNSSQEISGIILKYNSIQLTPRNNYGIITKNFIISGFYDYEQIQHINKLSSNQLSRLSNIINISDYENLSSYTASYALNNATSDNLKSAIIDAITAELKYQWKYGDDFFPQEQTENENEDNIISQICNDIQIELPKSISLSDNEAGQIPNVTLSFNGIKNTNISFTIIGFKEVTINQTETNNNRNIEIADELDSLLSNQINVTDFNVLNSQDNGIGLNNYSNSLKSEILDAIEVEIANYMGFFNFNGIQYTIAEIANGIKIVLPNSVSNLVGSNIQIPDVILSYNGINLISNAGSNTFTVIGYSSLMTKNNSVYPTQTNFINQQVANEISSILSDRINISNYENMNSYTAAIALSQYESNLKSAIIDAIINSIFPFDFKNISCSANTLQNELSITLPNYISVQNNVLAQIPGVELSFNGVLISSFISCSDTFIIDGFKTTTIAQTNANDNRNQEVVQILDSNAFIGNSILIGAYNNMFSYTAQEAFNNYQTSLEDAIAISIVDTVGSAFCFQGICYTYSQITSYIKVILPQTITPLDNQNAEIPNVMLQYNGITLKPSNSTSDTFVVYGFIIGPINTDISNNADILFTYYAQINKINNKNIYTE